MNPSVKALGQRLARDDNRSFASFIEWLIIEHARRKGVEFVRDDAPLVRQRHAAGTLA